MTAINDGVIDREVFTINCIQDLPYFDSRKLASIYANGAVERGYKPPRSLVCQFGQTLRNLRVKGIVKKHNGRQYVKVGGV